MRDDGHGEPLPLDLVDCEADPINGNGTFVDQASIDFRGVKGGLSSGDILNSAMFSQEWTTGKKRRK